MWAHIGFVTSSVFIGIREYFIYLFTGDQLQLVKNLAESLVSKNIFYVKILQSIAADSKLLCSEAIDYLSSYTDNVAYTPDEIDHEAINILKERGIQIPDIPQHSGLVSLVYKGMLNKNQHNGKGIHVAIKVRRVGIVKKLAFALDEMQSLMDFLDWLPSLKVLRLKEMFEENRISLMEQTDYSIETSNLITLLALNKNVPYIVVPFVHSDLAENLQERVIVMDWLNGRELLDLREEEKDNYSLVLAKFGIKCLLFDGVYHGDFHKGNIVFMGNGEDPVIGVIDLGVMGELDRDTQCCFYEFFKSIIDKDYESAIDSLMEGLISPQERVRQLTDLEKRCLKNNLLNKFKSTLDDYKDLGLEQINDLNHVFKEYDLRFSRSLSKIQLSLAIAEGVNRGLEVEHPFFQQMQRACREMFPAALLDI